MIPKFSEEEIKRTANQMGFRDDEKVPDTPISELIYRGIKLSSRYQKYNDYCYMMEWMSVIPDHVADSIDEVWFNTQSWGEFIITLKQEAASYSALGDLRDSIIPLARIKYNIGITIRAFDEDGEWCEDFDEENRGETFIECYIHEE